MIDAHKIKQEISSAVETYAGELPLSIVPTPANWGGFWYYEGAIAYSLIRASNSKNIVEMGTQRGTSTKYLGLAAQKNGGHVTTFEIDEQYVNKSGLFSEVYVPSAKEYIGDLPVSFIIGDMKTELKKLLNVEDIDFLLIDADHTLISLQWHIKELLPYIKYWYGFHDIDSRPSEWTSGEKEYILTNLKGQFVTTREIYSEWKAPMLEPIDIGHANSNSAVWFKGVLL